MMPIKKVTYSVPYWYPAGLPAIDYRPGDGALVARHGPARYHYCRANGIADPGFIVDGAEPEDGDTLGFWGELGLCRLIGEQPDISPAPAPFDALWRPLALRVDAKAITSRWHRLMVPTRKHRGDCDIFVLCFVIPGIRCEFPGFATAAEVFNAPIVTYYEPCHCLNIPQLHSLWPLLEAAKQAQKPNQSTLFEEEQ